MTPDESARRAGLACWAVRPVIAYAVIFGRELEQAGVPTKLELVRAFAGHVAKTIVEAGRDHQAGVIVRALEAAAI